MNVRRLRNDDGAILIIAIVVVTAVALVVGAVLTRGDGSVRATVALRQVAGTTYAADGAAQIAINALRTGYNSGDAEPPGWAFNNATGTGCFGYNSGGSTEDGFQLPGFYPAPKSSGQGPTSAFVECKAEDATGAQGSAVPINVANKPGNAILTLGSGGEAGLTFKTNGSSGAFRVRGGVWSNSNIVRENNGTLESTTSIRAHTGCSPASAMQAPVVDCSSGTVPDPNYPSDLDLAGASVPDLRTPPGGCGGGSVTLQPGYYDDATKLNALTPNGGSDCFIHLTPGTYYFDFHNSSSGYTIGGRRGTRLGRELRHDRGRHPDLGHHRAGPVRQPDRRRHRQGCPADLRRRQPHRRGQGCCHGAVRQLPRRPPPDRALRPEDGDGDPDGGRPANALTTSGPPTVTPSTFTGATAANLQAADGNTTTNTGLAVWARDATGPAPAQTGSITMTGFAPPTALPKGSVLVGARLKLTHMSDGAANAITLTPTPGGGPGTYTLPARTTLGTEDIDLSARTGWGAFQKSVHDDGFTGASLKFDASLAKNKTARLDAARLELTYYLPSLRGQTTAAITGNTVATPGGEPVLKALGNTTLVYIQGTTYTPLASTRPRAEQHLGVGVQVRGHRSLAQDLRDRVVLLSGSSHRAAGQLAGLGVQRHDRPAQGVPVPGVADVQRDDRQAGAQDAGAAVGPDAALRSRTNDRSLS